MSFITCSFYSKILQKATQFNAIIPQGKEHGAPVLYLLHGLRDDYTAWSRYTSIERYAEEAGVAVIMPDGARGFYTDMVHGNKYYTYFTHELFPYINALFSLSREREKTFIAGVSMGGYGALKFALLNPDVFGAAASLSGAVDVCDRLSRDPRWSETKALVFGDECAVSGSDNDLFGIIKRYNSEAKPRLYIACGEEDFLYQNNLNFSNALSQTAIPYRFYSEPGVHDWRFWDSQVQSALSFFLNEN